MPIPAGGMNQRVQFVRAGADLGDWQWCRYRFERPSTVTIVGQPFQGKSAQLTVRRCTLTESIRMGDRARVGLDLFNITLIRKPEADSDDVAIEVESAPSPALYADEIGRRGEVVSLRRAKPRTNPEEFEAEADVRAIVTGYQPNELSAGMQQGDSRVILLAADVHAAGFPVPLRVGGLDSVWFGGRKRTIQKVDDATHRYGGELLAYDLTVRG